MNEAQVAIVVSPRDWAERLHRFLADHGGARVRARVLDAREAGNEDYTVLVAEDLTSFLTPRLMHELRQQGRSVLGVYDPSEPWGRERLVELGVDEVIEATAAPDAFLAKIQELGQAAELAQRIPELLAEAAGDNASEAGAIEDSVAAERAAGHIIAVSGPPGGCGVSEVAIGLGGALGRRRDPTVVVDGNDEAPSLAQRLGLPQHPNIRTAMDVVEHRSGALRDALTPVESGRFLALAGLPSARDWHTIRPGEFVDALAVMTSEVGHVAVDVGHSLEDLGGLSGSGRFDVARSVLRGADAVVAVGAPTANGVARLLSWIADASEITHAPIHLIVNRCPKSGFQKSEIAAEIARTYEPASLVFAPVDRRVDRASWDGRPVPRGPFTRSIDALATRVAPRIPVRSFAAQRHPVLASAD